MAIDGDNGTSTVGGGNTGYNWSGYAEWLAKTKNSTKTCNLIVNYYANGYNGSAAENPPPSSVRSYTGQSVDVRLVVEVASGDTMSNPGYVFVGWATSNNTPTVTYNPGDTISNSWAADYRGNSVTNLYAVWTNQNVITYNPDDNSIEKSAIYQVKQSGQSAILKGATFTRTGYTQTGWATTAGGPKVYNLGGAYSSNNPLSLYPVWQANTYTITYVANEGTGTMADQTVTYDSTFTPRACSFTREGYSFSSWNESQDGKGIRWKVQEYTVDRAENITLYAIWKGNEYTVYYDDNYSRYSDEITGDIVTFESEYAQPLKKVEVSLSPIQDLHGYDHPWIGTDYDQQPYNFRAVSSSSISPLGNSEMGKIVGGTVAWNQLIKPNFNILSPYTNNGITYTRNADGSISAVGTVSGYSSSYAQISNNEDVVIGHKYLVDSSSRSGVVKIWYNGTGGIWSTVRSIGVVTVKANGFYIRIDRIGTEVNETINPQVYDLTQMFGSTIADYIYSLEQANAGAGVAWFRKLFPKPYYAYNAGTLMSVQAKEHNTVGFNAWDEEWRLASLNTSTGAWSSIGTYTQIASANMIRVVPGATYYFASSNSGGAYVAKYKEDGTYIGYQQCLSTNRTFTVPDDCHYIMFQMNGYGTTYNHDICINLSWDGEKDGTYEPYELHSYALDSSLTLRGIPKLDSDNKLYYDGDTYEADGTVTRKYGIVDLGTLTWTWFSQYKFYSASLNGKLAGVTNLFTSKFDTKPGPWDGSDPTENITWGNGSNSTIYVRTTVSYENANAFKTAMSGVYLIYELATPTTEEADPYQNPQIVDDFGTEEYVDAGVAAGTRDVAIPVGHETTFANICPISGRTGVSVYVSPTQDVADATTYAIDWTSEAGTVYGGTLDVVTGVLTVDWAYFTDKWKNGTGATSIGSYTRRKFTHAVKSKYPNYVKTPICNVANYKAAFAEDSLHFYVNDDISSNIIVFLPNDTDGETDIQVCYELATPLTYQLTAQEIEALVGANNVWSDGGPITIVYALDEVPQNMPPSTAIFGDIFYTRRNQLSRFGLTFKGWNTVPDGSGEAWLPSGVSMGTYKRTEDAVWNVSHNVTLYAQWDPNVYPFGTVFFNGRNAQDLGIIVEELPSYYYAERAFNHKQVNGKNGDVILDTGRYENVKKVYKVACYDPSRNFYESAVALSTFLHSAGSDYIRLEDSYEPSSYRMAIYEETNEIENLLGKAGRCEITFNCMPQRFLLSGDEEITIPSSGYSIYNPTAFDAKPMIRIQGTGTVTINGRSVQVTENDNDMLVDCENQNAKDLSGADMNYFIYCDEFPILKPGFNTISYTETIDAVKITPRWWIL